MSKQITSPATEAPEPAAGYVVDRVVVCDAYLEPDCHYKLLPGGKSKLVDGRRPSMRFLASAKATKGGITGVVGKDALLLEDLAASEEQLNEFVNQLRNEVRAWRESGYPGTARVTRKLLEWWFERDEERSAEFKRLFFCQQEAIETVVFLYEVRKRFKFKETGDIVRYALKLATGTGKTHVMAVLVVWSTLHKLRVSGSTLSANFLVLVPNLTVRDRVWGTDPLTNLPTGEGLDPNSPENLYEAFDIVPPEFKEEFHSKVQIRVSNWQSIPLDVARDDWIAEKELGGGRFVPASVLWQMQRRAKADPRKAVRKVLGGWRDVVIVNDEAHHVYGEKKSRTGEPQFVVWDKIIKRVKESVNLPLMVDLSATPWYGSGSPKQQGTLFEWLVGDFSVYDAFESGLVKVVRLPDPAEEGHRYLNLWDDVSGAKTKQEYLSGCKGAVASIYSSWKDDYTEWAQGKLFGDQPSPVMLVVADRHERARWIFEHLTAEYELLRNPEGDDPSNSVTIQVDSRTFDAEKGNEAVLRGMVNTVGQPDKAGEHVRCIVSVNMLSEGWNVKNVTHIIGLRAFGSPLLTEQVIGRGLRRVDTTALNTPLEERKVNPNRPDEETVDAFGIPFIGFPVERRKRKPIRGWGKTSTPIAPDPKKEKFAVELPNVRAWAVGVSQPLVESVPVDRLPSITIDPGIASPDIIVKPVVGGKPEGHLTIDRFRDEYPLSRTMFLLAQELYEMVSAEEAGVLTGPTFEEVLEFVTDYVNRRVEAKGNSLVQDLGIYYWRQIALNILQTAVQDAPTEMITVPIRGVPPVLATSSVPEFKWPGVTAPGRKTHLSKVPYHTDLEAEFSVFLDEASDVERYVKNERLGFSITYYENQRPRQYFPDFMVRALGVDGPVWWLVETKGEIRPNTAVKSGAAELWCERMSRTGEDRWEHQFVQEKVFKKAKKAGVSTFAKLVETIRKVRPSLSLVPPEDSRVQKQSFKTLLPVYALEAAAGYFGEGKAVDVEGWVEVRGFGRLSDDMFVAKAVGHSMQPKIQDGDYLVFRAHPKGTREGKIVLARGPIEDPDIGGPFTVKKYSSEKIADEDGGWRHSRITLSPLNKSYEPIVVDISNEEEQISVVAELLGRLEA
jgi:type III restriction enzyme